MYPGFTLGGWSGMEEDPEAGFEPAPCRSEPAAQPLSFSEAGLR